MIQLGRYNPIFFNPRRYRYGTGEYVQRFDVEDLITFEFFSGKGETAAVRLNNLSTGEALNVEMTIFSLSDDVDVHYASLQPGEGMYSVTIGDTQSIESEPFCVCQCRETTSLLEYSNADNNVDMGAFVNGEERIPFMFRFEGGFIPFGTEYRVEDEAFRNQRQRIRHLYSGAYEVLKLTVGDTSMGCPEWYASFFNTVLCLSEIKINGEVFARGEGAVPEKTQMQEGSNLIYFTIDMEAEGGSVAGTGGGNFNQGGGGGFSVYIITTDDLTAASDRNVFSALRTILEIETRSLSKTKEDTTNFLLHLLGGVITDFIQSQNFISGMMGTGMCFKVNEDGTTYAEIDRLLVRMKAYFQMLTIMRTEFGGKEWVLNAGAQVKCTKVEYIEDVPAYFTEGTAAYFSDGKRAHFPGFYRCHFLSDDGETAVENTFKVGDMARAQDFNIKAGVYEGVSNRFLWRKVIGVGDGYIDLSSADCAEGSDIPKEGDTLVQMGNDRDPDRQNLIVLSAFGDGAPSITFYRGVDSYSLSGREVFTVGWDSANGECRFDCYGRTYIGDRKRESYFEFVPGKGASLVIGGQDVGATLKAMPGGIMSQVSSVVSGLRSEIRQTTDSISLKVEDMRTDISGINSGLSATGIDIGAKTVTLTASQFLVKDNSGTGIAVFKLVGGKPVLKTENIDVDSLKVKHLDGADGTFVGLLKASAVYTQMYNVSGEEFTIDPNVHGTAFFGCNNYASGGKHTLKMPSVSKWAGINIKACNITMSRLEVGLFLEASGEDLFYIGSLTDTYKYCWPNKGNIVDFIAYNPDNIGFWIISSPNNCIYSNDLTSWYDSEGKQVY